MGALLANNYDRALILGYTNQQKAEVAENELSKVHLLPNEAAGQKVYEYANTPGAHCHYMNWLKAALAENGRQLELNFKPVPLKNLNDSEGIFQAAKTALSEATNGEKKDATVTFHLSPGTPVMAFNLTGGTKLMYAGAFSACSKVNATPLYFNLAENNIVNLQTGARRPLKPITSSIDLIKLNCLDKEQYIKNNGAWENIRARLTQGNVRQELSAALFKNHEKIQKLYADLVNYNDDNNIKDFELPVYETSECKVFHKAKNSQEGTVILGGKLYGPIRGWHNFAKYLSGGWFEEYVYGELKPLEEAGIIHDLRINVRIAYNQSSIKKKSGAAMGKRSSRI